MRKNFNTIPFHTVFSAAFPAVSLIGYNILEMHPGEGLRAVLISVLVGLISWGFLFLILRNAEKSAIITTVGVIIFFSYGHIHESFPLSIIIFGAPIRNHRYLAPISLALFLGVSWLILKYFKNSSEITRVLNIMTVVALLLPIYQISAFMLREARENQDNTDPQPLAISGNSVVQRDVYLFVLDMYPREDYLLEEMGIDNSGFTQDLENLGFYVAQCSQSNYQRTRMTLSSMLNMAYFEDIFDDLEALDGDLYYLHPLITNNEVRTTFEQMGYDVVAFETGYEWTEWADADYYYSVDWDKTDAFINQMIDERVVESSLAIFLIKAGVNDFEWLLLKTTGFSLILDQSTSGIEKIESESDYIIQLRKLRLTHFVFDALMDSVPAQPDPKFVFAHILMPHPPHAFTADGNFLFEDLPEDEAFADNMNYLNTRLIPILETIIDQSDIEPIIIIMGDHGPFIPDTYKLKTTEILNAYYLPEGNTDLLYSDISPINTFRLVLQEYFGKEYELLEDKSLFSSHDDAYSFYEVQNPLSNCDEITE